MATSAAVPQPGLTSAPPEPPAFDRRAISPWAVPAIGIILVAVAGEAFGAVGASAAAGLVLSATYFAVGLLLPGPPQRGWLLIAALAVGLVSAVGLVATAVPLFHAGNEQQYQSVNMRGRTLSQEMVNDLDLRGSDLSGAQLTDLDLRKKSLAGVTAKGADFRRARLDGVSLRGADLSGADLTDTCLGGADLAGANLAGARIQGIEAPGKDVNLKSLGAVGTPARAAPLGCQ